MRWRHRPRPTHVEIRTKRQFAWWPIKIKPWWVWLERYEVIGEYHHDSCCDARPKDYRELEECNNLSGCFWRIKQRRALDRPMRASLPAGHNQQGEYR